MDVLKLHGAHKQLRQVLNSLKKDKLIRRYNKKLYNLDTIGAEENILIQCIVHTRVVYTLGMYYMYVGRTVLYMQE